MQAIAPFECVWGPSRQYGCAHTARGGVTNDLLAGEEPRSRDSFYVDPSHVLWNSSRCGMRQGRNLCQEVHTYVQYRGRFAERWPWWGVAK